MNKFLFEYNNRKFSTQDLSNALKKAGIRVGDKLFIHSDIKSFGKVNPKISQEEYLGAFVKALTSVVGEKGTVIMPTFSYSFCKGEVYNPQSTPSTVGSLTEYFRKLPDALRTIDPIFSVSIWGADKKFYQDVGPDCFGEKSIFEKIYKKDFKIIFLGETFDLTYLHSAEQSFKVPYRYIKKFTGQIEADNKLKEYSFDYYVRDLDKNPVCDLKKIENFFKNKGILKETALGYSKIRAVGAKDAHDAILETLKADKFGLLTEESKKELIGKSR